MVPNAGDKQSSRSHYEILIQYLIQDLSIYGAT